MVLSVLHLSSTYSTDLLYSFLHPSRFCCIHGRIRAVGMEKLPSLICRCVGGGALSFSQEDFRINALSFRLMTHRNAALRNGLCVFACFGKIAQC